MASHFEMLPQELIEILVLLLSFSDICSLRSVSRAICAKSSAGCFRSFFQHKHIILTNESLQKFADLTSKSSLCRHVQSLTLCGTSSIDIPTDDDGDVQMLEAEASTNHWTLGQDAPCSTPVLDQSDLLSKAFLNISNSTSRTCLRNITLTVEPAPDEPITLHKQYYNSSPPYQPHWGSLPQGPGWLKDKLPRTWRTAASTFELVMGALQKSRTSCDSLDVFSSVEECSLYRDRFAAWLNSQQELYTLRSLKHLKLSLSTASTFSAIEGVDAVQPLMTKLFASARQLETLHVHWYKLPRQNEEPVGVIRAADLLLKDFESHPRVTPLRTLTACTLEGLYTTTTNLVAFLRLMPSLRELRIDRLTLEESTSVLRDVFEVITGEMEQLQTLVLSDFQNPCLIQFNDPSAAASSHIPVGMGGGVMGGQQIFGRNTLARRGPSIRTPIDWEDDHSEFWDTAVERIRRRAIWKKYGH